MRTQTSVTKIALTAACLLAFASDIKTQAARGVSPEEQTTRSSLAAVVPPAHVAASCQTRRHVRNGAIVSPASVSTRQLQFAAAVFAAEPRPGAHTGKHTLSARAPPAA
jgi:hypothetical protein